MAIKIFHPDHGYVITSDQDQINMLLEKGGEIVVKKEIIANENEEIKEATKAEVSALKHIKRKAK